MRYAIDGGGVLGLTAGLRLAQREREVFWFLRWGDIMSQHSSGEWLG